jgi:hypothetical protein
MRSRAVAGVTLCLVIGGILVSVFAFPASGKTLPWPFANVSQAQLSRGGLSLTPLATPTNLPSRLATSRQVAALVTAHNFSRSRGFHLAPPHYMHCRDQWARNPTIDEDCWAVVVDPTNFVSLGSPLAPPPASAKWGIVLVHPRTGRIIDTRAGSD